jgi:hypothetical protein
MSTIKNLFSKKNFFMIIGILSILIFFWTIMYLVPSFFVNLFNTLLGNIILLGIVLVIAMFNKKIAFGLAILFIIIYQFSNMTSHINSNIKNK